MESKFIEISNPNRITLDYQIIGKGKPILFLHGGGTNYRNYKDFLELLSSNYQVIAFSYPGFGYSSNIKGYTLENFNIVIDELLSKLDVEEIFIVGHSLGAGLAINYSTYNNRYANIKGMAVISPFIYKVNKNFIKMIRDIAKQTEITKTILFYKKTKNSTLAYLKNRLININASINSYRLYRFIKQNELVNNLDKISISVVGFYGTNDIVLPTEDQRKGLNLIKDAKVIEFEEKGHHLIHTDKGKIFNEIQKTY